MAVTKSNKPASAMKPGAKSTAQVKAAPGKGAGLGKSATAKK